MDPLTHTLLGASLGYATFEKKLGRTAAWVGGLAAFIPDADVFIRSKTDPLLAIEYHRHFTHALAFAPVGALLVAGLACLWRAQRPHFFLLWGCATMTYFSHCFLDTATSYGTQLLWPFTNARFGWDFISVIDPLFTLPLAIALTWALVKKRPTLARVGLAAGLVYMGAGVIQHARAAAAQEVLAKSRGHTRERFEVMPTIANNIVWRSLYIHAGSIYSDRIRTGWFSRASAREGSQLPLLTAADLSAEEQARNENSSFERFSWFSDEWVARSPGDPRVIGDMRYSLSAEAFDPIWGIRFTTPSDPTEIEWINRTRDRKIDVGEVWREISGDDSRFKPLHRIR